MAGCWLKEHGARAGRRQRIEVRQVGVVGPARGHARTPRRRVDGAGGGSMRVQAAVHCPAAAAAGRQGVGVGSKTTIDDATARAAQWVGTGDGEGEGGSFARSRE